MEKSAMKRKMVVIGSMFRNSEAYLPNYFEQIAALGDALHKLDCSMRLIVAEGDSTDNTYKRLHHYSDFFKTEIIKRAHGGRAMGSIDHPERWKQIAFVFNGILEHVTESDDYFILVESDLVWEANAILRMLNRLGDGVDAVAAMCFHVSPNGSFYDVWGHRAGGVRFDSPPPYHPALANLPKGDLLRMDSAGSCIAMKAVVARAARFSDAEAVVGFGRDINAKGFSLWLEPEAVVVHP